MGILCPMAAEQVAPHNVVPVVYSSLIGSEIM